MKRNFLIITALAVILSAGAVWAQAMFVQIEAQPTLEQAQSRAQAYAAQLPDVNGFRLGTSWFAIALGPYNQADATARMQALKASRAISADAYLVRQGAYSTQFFPANGSALSTPALSVGQSDTETAVQEPPAIPAEPPQESRREALRSEGQLSRQGKFNLQIALRWFGFYDGAIDAAFGPGTRGSMAAWQTSKGYEPTGVLTTRQRGVLTGEYEAVLDTLDLRLLRDETAGIELQMPRAMVAFDRYDPPFAHYTAINDSGVSVLLISQTGDADTLLGLFDIMQTLAIVPLDGERARSADRFTLTGANDEITSYTQAVLQDGTVKGFTLIWPTGDDSLRQVTLKAMLDSFVGIDGAVLPDTVGAGALEQSLDLLSGLEIRRAQSARSGFYVDGQGTVLTTAPAVQGCARITLDEVYDAEIIASDDTLGLALLRPVQTLSPLDYARFQTGEPRLQSEVAVSGYSFEGMLSAPSLTFGTLADIKGLRGEPTMKRLALTASPGDAGGPVFDSSGSVLGMLLPAQTGGKQLPGDVSFATDALAIAEFLSQSGYAPAAAEFSGAMSAEELTRRAAKLTVLVSCWGE